MRAWGECRSVGTRQLSGDFLALQHGQAPCSNGELPGRKRKAAAAVEGRDADPTCSPPKAAKEEAAQLPSPGLRHPSQGGDAPCAAASAPAAEPTSWLHPLGACSAAPAAAGSSQASVAGSARTACASPGLGAQALGGAEEWAAVSQRTNSPRAALTSWLAGLDDSSHCFDFAGLLDFETPSPSPPVSMGQTTIADSSSSGSPWLAGWDPRDPFCSSLQQQQQQQREGVEEAARRLQPAAAEKALVAVGAGLLPCESSLLLPSLEQLAKVLDAEVSSCVGLAEAALACSAQGGTLPPTPLDLPACIPGPLGPEFEGPFLFPEGDDPQFPVVGMECTMGALCPLGPSMQQAMHQPAAIPSQQHQHQQQGSLPPTHSLRQGPAGVKVTTQKGQESGNRDGLLDPQTQHSTVCPAVDSPAAAASAASLSQYNFGHPLPLLARLRMPEGAPPLEQQQGSAGRQGPAEQALHITLAAPSGVISSGGHITTDERRPSRPPQQHAQALATAGSSSLGDVASPAAAMLTDAAAKEVQEKLAALSAALAPALCADEAQPRQPPALPIPGEVVLASLPEVQLLYQSCKGHERASLHQLHTGLVCTVQLVRVACGGAAAAGEQGGEGGAMGLGGTRLTARVQLRSEQGGAAVAYRNGVRPEEAAVLPYMVRGCLAWDSHDGWLVLFSQFSQAAEFAAAINQAADFVHTIEAN